MIRKYTKILLVSLILVAFASLFFIYVIPYFQESEQKQEISLVDFESCNNNQYCIKQKTLQMKTFEDYDAFASLDDFKFFGSLFVDLYDAMSPSDRGAIPTVESCDELKDPQLQYRCKYAYKLHRDINFDCDGEEEFVEIVSGPMTTSFSPQNTCAMEKGIALAKNGYSLEDCSNIEDGIASYRCSLMIVLRDKDESQCDTLVQMEENKFDMMMCKFFLQEEKTLGFCDGDAKCIGQINLIFPILSMTTSDDDCDKASSNDCEALRQKIRIDQGKTINCYNEECRDYSIARKIYLDPDVLPEEIQKELCMSEGEDERETCRIKTYNAYALAHKNIEYCVWDYDGWEESACFDELSDQISIEEGFCDTFGIFSEEDAKEDQLAYCLGKVNVKQAIVTLDFSLCEELEWPDDDNCNEQLFETIKETKNFDATLCEKSERGDCVENIKNLQAVAEGNLAICMDENCVKEVMSLDDFEGDCSMADIWNDFCLDALKKKELGGDYNLSDCLQFNDQAECINTYFGKENLSEFRFEECTQFDSTKKSYNFIISNKNMFYSSPVNSLQDLCYTHGVFLLEDVSGCMNRGCIEKYMKERATFSTDCSTAGMFHALAEGENTSLIEGCENLKNDKKALYEHDLALCRSETCLDDFLGFFENGKFKREFVKTLDISVETRSKLFLDTFDNVIVDWEKDTIFQDVLIVDEDVIKGIMEEVSAEEISVIENILQRRKEEYLFKACDGFDPDLKDFWGESVKEECQEKISSYFSSE